VNISDDLYVDRPSSVVEMLRIEEDHQTGQEHSLSAINRSHRSFDNPKENHEKVNIQDKSSHCLQ
jgi:lipase chaperone LimK